MLLRTIPIRNPQEAAAAAVSLVPADRNDLQALLVVIRELCLNVLNWSESDGNVFVEKENEVFTATVLDRGIGIPATIGRVYPDLSDEEAVALALLEGKTASGQDFRGWGLPATLALTERDGFSAYLESGDVAVWMRDGDFRLSAKSGGAIDGTLVSVTYSG